MFGPGDPVPALKVRALCNPNYALDSVAGRYVVLTFVGGVRQPGARAYLEQLYRDRATFDDSKACCFVVINDAQDEAVAAIGDRMPGIRVIWDGDFTLARRLGAVVERDGKAALNLVSFLLDPGQRVLDVLPVEDFATHHDQLRARMAALPDPSQDIESWAPVLLVPNIIEPELCRAFIDYARREGVEDSGFMKTDPATGQTMLVVDHAHKRRSDCSVEDADLRNALQARIMRRLVPQIERAFQFKVSRMERYIVARYDADGGGWFRPHKDNTTAGTAHRRFAVSINLNAEEHLGGDLRFPEFGRRTYRPSTGGAIVFSCSLLHEATPITRGERFCLLPFLYDEAAAQLRLDNARHLADPELRDSVTRSVLAPPGWFEPPKGQERADAA